MNSYLRILSSSLLAIGGIPSATTTEGLDELVLSPLSIVPSFTPDNKLGNVGLSLDPGSREGSTGRRGGSPVNE